MVVKWCGLLTDFGVVDSDPLITIVLGQHYYEGCLPHILYKLNWR